MIKNKTMKYIKNLSKYALPTIIILLILILYRSCNIAKERDRLLGQIAQYQLTDKDFQFKRLKDSSTIATQRQTILSQREAIQLGLVELNDRMKKLQSQVKTKSDVVIVEKPVPFIPNGWADTTGLVKDENGNVIRQDSIAVPQRFKLEERWFNIDGFVRKSGLMIDTLKIPNKSTISVGYKKTGFLNLKKEAVVQVKNDNPYLVVTGMDNVIIKQKRPFWKSPLFTFAIGFLVANKIKL